MDNYTDNYVDQLDRSIRYDRYEIGTRNTKCAGNAEDAAPAATAVVAAAPYGQIKMCGQLAN